MLLTIVPKVCFICGTYGNPNNRIVRHHVIPKKIFNNLNKSNVQNVTIPLCNNCHCGIHHRHNGLFPNKKQWNIVKSIINNRNDYNKIIKEVVDLTIVKSVTSISDYRKFLEYQERHKRRLH